ncbi:DUF5077 domain-containing protein [Cellulophaga sp. F20128]|uniref:DUF3472 domain-containing protein n=1 Tax=Cellulophaga sp. F20128 TaxID=2926413 RepID=UPI001FF613A4|nr:DUF3472 domain-containing protein [Cellulophaga sp. F20128]MCK0158043.1 DUF5077 domain-containing protein [Cellulophaga sp. F20128]
MRIQNIIYILSILLISACKSGSNTDKNGKELELSIAVPPGGNSWIVNNLEENRKVISKEGIQSWTNTESVIRTYFKTNAAGEIHVGLMASVPEGKSKIKVTVGNTSKEVKLTGADLQKIQVGTFKLKTAGYHFIEIQGIEKSDATIATIKEVLIGGPATHKEVTFVKEDFYWGRRGPSVHLSYQAPKDIDIQWFYNEITVPEKEDVIGSYYMANGFGEGYFGMQVNSETERRVLFSVWSPYETQNPNDIPEDYKIILLGKGAGVTTGEFGNEGSGGQSYKVFNWKAGNTYKFLLKGEPSVNNSTDYTAYFFAPEENEWKLIASFRRPHTSTYLKRQHSFLENFVTSTGFKSRKGLYSNQWVHDTKGVWHELTKAKFTADATARKGSRLDYAGGVEGNNFFMENCGFFSETTTIDATFERKANGIAPQIEFSKLPKK